MTPPFTIRVATEDDLPSVVELAVELVTTSRSPYREGVSDDQIRLFRRQNFDHLASLLEMPEGGLFIAVDEAGNHIGHILLLGNQIDTVAEIRQAWVYDVSVRRDWWGKGVGRTLMARGEDFARELGLEYIGLGVTRANERAVDFYRELGYDVERVQMVKRLRQ
jgi:ribosomal protein S18 acetylase RimI-like enzyme